MYVVHPTIHGGCASSRNVDRALIGQLSPLGSEWASSPARHRHEWCQGGSPGAAGGNGSVLKRGRNKKVIVQVCLFYRFNFSTWPCADTC